MHHRMAHMGATLRPHCTLAVAHRLPSGAGGAGAAPVGCAPLPCGLPPQPALQLGRRLAIRACRAEMRQLAIGGIGGGSRVCGAAAALPPPAAALHSRMARSHQPAAVRATLYSVRIKGCLHIVPHSPNPSHQEQPHAAVTDGNLPLKLAPPR